jgi:REP element-mobilizing transposase RayT
MKYDREKHHRHSVRLRGYDYSSPGAYFITLCAWNRECIFGEIIDGEIKLNACGTIVQQEWMRSLTIRREIELDEFIIMPNHVHGVVFINSNGNATRDVGANGRSPLRMQSRSLSSFIAGFKSAVTKSINISRNTPGMPVWQRNYFERVIRNENELFRIREYIHINPAQWDIDEENPDVGVVP